MKYMSILLAAFALLGVGCGSTQSSAGVGEVCTQFGLCLRNEQCCSHVCMVGICKP
jgi:hypothetical protein